MNRNSKALKHVNKDGLGLEIGPSHNPLAPKKQGYKVQIIDHLNQEQLIAKYKDHGVNLSNIEAVDFVWQGESLPELTNKTKHYDWVIASHVIEHVPDLISFLNGCDSILKDDGVISLVIPDKRYCFDHFRPITGISKIIDSYYQKNTIHTPGAVAEYYLNVVSKSGNIAWKPYYPGEYQLVHSLEEAVQGMDRVVSQGAYLDIHAWCFTPHSFRLIIHDLFHLGLIHLQEVDFFPTAGCEFYVTLGRKGSGMALSRLEILDIVDKEIAHEVAQPFSMAEIKARISALPAYLKNLLGR
jgi:2-polyprenyl-3-methyl-5-hydroxy-6-metoxy-1,4-benzoquinol methylase